VVVDEVQLRPDLFPLLRVLADRRPTRARFLLLGSASPDLVRHSAESLAGRVAFVPMGGFGLGDVGMPALRRLWLRGGFPRAFLAPADMASRRWREDFVQTFLERDIRKFGVEVPPEALRRLWTMLAHYHGGIWNASELSRSLGEAHTTVKRHLEILCGAFMVRRLPPWFENLGKRQVKSPKVYLRDSGVLHALLGLTSFADMEGHPKLGASWEGFVIEHVLRRTGERDAYFWATPSGAELDLLVFVRGRRIGFEMKYVDAPRMTKSMAVALEDLKLDRLLVVYPGDASYPIRPRVDAVAIRDLESQLDGLARSPRRTVLPAVQDQEPS
jgi:predicted AAA+ superfamily ATPase